MQRSLAEALEQQAATAEILRVISSSPTDLQPVLMTVAENAARVCGAIDAQIYRVEREFLHWVASHGPIPPNTEERLISRGWVTGRAVVDRRTIHVHDLAAESDTEYPVGKAAQRQTGHRTTLSTPLLREGVPLGVISIRRMEVRPFSEKQVRLLETFADQAVIAIENVRLFNEMNEALERQTATSEILRVISSSPTDVAPVFATIVRSAVRLSGARRGALFRFDGELVHLVAHHNQPPEALESLQRAYPMRLGRAQVSGRAILSRAVAEIQDVRNDPEYLPGMAAEMELGSLLGVPMLRADGAPSGAIVIQRSEVGPFAAGHVKLLETFADQAVIAIENVRLFTELEVRNRDLTMALGRQTATSEILSVISTSPTDTQPVFNTIIQSAVRLLSGFSGVVTRLVSGQLQLAALTSTNPSGDAAQKALWPKPLKEDKSLHGQVITALEPRFIADVESDPSVPPGEVTVARARGYRSIIAVPLVRNARAVGSMTVTRCTPGPFSDSEIALLKTFAAQAVIAIENVRLFTELQEKNRALTQAHAQVSEALEQQTATAEILRVISSSPTDVTPVFMAIAESARRLCVGHFCNVVCYDGNLLHLGAFVSPEGLEAIQRILPMRPTRATVAGRVVLEAARVHVPDIQQDADYNQPVARAVRGRSLLGVPMLRDGQPIGVIVVGRSEPLAFTDKEIKLLETFADQAVIAVENLRLFKELKARTADLTRSVEQLTALGEVGRALSSTLDLETVLTTIVTRAVQLTGLEGGVVFEYHGDAEVFVHRAATETGASLAEARRTTQVRKGEGVVGRTAITLEPAQVPDITVPGAYESRLRENLIASGVRAILAVPMLSEARLIGCLVVSRNQPGEFPAETIDLLRTFAAQSALAIQNARLFEEIADKSRQLEAASRHKSEFLASMSHELRTPLNGILGFNEMILGEIYGEVPSDLREPLTEMQASGRHLLRLINNVLDLSKIEAGRMELALADYVVPDVVEQVRASLHPLAADKGLEFVTVVPADLPLAHGDAGRITQCLTNLAGNALKFTREGRVEIVAELRGETLVYRVSDTGIGIAPDRIETLFTEFRQADPTIASEFGGSGLGLSITRKFAEMHDGRVWVESEPGRGSTFFLALPLRVEGGAPK